MPLTGKLIWLVEANPREGYAFYLFIACGDVLGAKRKRKVFFLGVLCG